uniref:Uncharacterized protein n=1 Tax=Candidatus Kentrum sp. MB TaxID=2138164 RepID=A0A451B922_9GAMM|nr:MAG: hypothetical protein BECKMB1821G_GA0114241_103620 [Candidatus Kentron sp. MB]VFK29473.1 MAG: hypothetical protein BECKMB1821I_GA0114274_101019 [Candidatus Kentron sp. MB]VFK74793.1 MAG: hypothetical protein BECKMB1821H_GA0114242_101019 [Candidatus Kentron sp. MB]
MSESDIITLYVLINEKIYKLWEFYVLGHLAMVGWYMSVDQDKINRAKKTLTITYVVLFGGLYLFFLESYNELTQIQQDLKSCVTIEGIPTDGYIYKILEFDVSSDRCIRTTVIYLISFICSMYLLFGKTLTSNMRRE